MPRTLNFTAGPAAMPLPALERAREELVDFAGTGMSVMEHSHRGKEYEAVHNEALALIRELYDVPDTYDVLFLQGGASQQFAQVPMNFLSSGRSADYVITGTWSEKAHAEAKLAAALAGASVRVAANTAVGEGKAATWTRAPLQDELKLNPEAAYLHFTSNETIHGVEFELPGGVPFPSPGRVPLVCDMSSDFMWRPLDIEPFSFIYAGAQKNVGPSGVLVVIARKEFLESGRRDLPKIFQYRTAAENDSLYNTPPTFGIYLARNVLAWIKASGGLEQIEEWNLRKAELLYEAIDSHPHFYRCPVQRNCRSVMNAVFRLPNEALEEKFLTEARKRRMVGLKGHRSVGGIRVSLYNAVSLEWVQTLVDFMSEFVRSNA
jgi:phosphoserine aminotransferase